MSIQFSSKRIFLLLTFASLVFILSGQNKSRKGQVYFYWGWNREFFSKSDIHYTGSNYDFTLKNVRAHDIPKKFDYKLYFLPWNISIPQFNFRVGYYINNRYDISFGTDHMKYRTKDYQSITIDGTIQNSGTIYDGEYSNQKIEMTPSLAQLEHSNGLNYVNVELRRSTRLYERKHLNIESRLGIGSGIIYPKTASHLLNNPSNDEFHLAGYGLDLVGAIHFEFFKYLFIQLESKAGFIHLPDILTTPDKNDRASQAFFFNQYNWVFGLKYKIIRN